MNVRVNLHRQQVLAENFDPGTDGGDLARDLVEARQLIARLANALRHLAEEQNGPPLPGRREASWHRAMDKTWSLLDEAEPYVDSFGMTIED